MPLEMMLAGAISVVTGLATVVLYLAGQRRRPGGRR